MNAKNKLVPAGGNITCEVATISPEVAAAMLDQSPGNRKIAPGTVSAYARDMKAKKWALTTEPICFDKGGQLLNGHHRLKACIEADTPFQSLVSYGLEPSARDFMDQGRPRKAADVLTFAGYHNALKLAALANMLMAIKSGSYDGGSRARRTTQEISAVVKKHPGLTASIMTCGTAVGINGTLLAAIHYVGKIILGEDDTADAFASVFKTGTPTYVNDPAHLLRERGLRSRSQRETVKRTEQIKAAIHAWNLFRKGQPMAQFKWPKEVTFDDLDLKKL